MSEALAGVLHLLASPFLPRERPRRNLLDEFMIIAEGDFDIAVNAWRDEQNCPSRRRARQPVLIENILPRILVQPSVRAIREFRATVGMFPMTHYIPYSHELHCIGKTAPEDLAPIFAQVRDALEKAGPFSFKTSETDPETFQANYSRLRLAMRYALVDYRPRQKAA